MTHPQKVRLARKMRTQKEITAHTSIWDTKAWLTRREARTGIKGGRNRPLPLHIRRLIGRSMGDLPQQKETMGSRIKNIFTGKKSATRQKVV